MLQNTESVQFAVLLFEFVNKWCKWKSVGETQKQAQGIMWTIMSTLVVSETRWKANLEGILPFLDAWCNSRPCSILKLASCLLSIVFSLLPTFPFLFLPLFFWPLTIFSFSSFPPAVPLSLSFSHWILNDNQENYEITSIVLSQYSYINHFVDFPDNE